MQRQAYCDYLHQTSTERVKMSRASMGKSRTLLELAKARVLRSRQRPLDFVPLEDLSPDVADTPAVRVIPGKRSADLALAPEMVTGRDIEGELVRLDGRHFVDCTLRNCTLEYGGSVVVLESTQFFGCSFRFTDGAAMTVQLLECFGIVSDSAPAYVTGGASAAAGSKPN